jgi:hypothetical protein
VYKEKDFCKDFKLPLLVVMPREMGTERRNLSILSMERFVIH